MRAQGHPRRESRTLYAHDALILVSSVLTIASQGKFTSSITLNHPPSRSLRYPALFPLGQGAFTHNTADDPFIVACTKADLIDDNTDLVGAGMSGVGGMGKWTRDEWEERKR